MKLALRLSLLILLQLLPAYQAGAQEGQVVKLSRGVAYQRIGRLDADQLNKILKVDTPAFAGITVTYSPARNAVSLYRVTYASVVPERGNKPTVTSGLLAVPDVDGKSLPMVTYQHGTVYGKQEVPSFPEQSPETQLMIAQFAGQGYVVIGADYFGLGTSTEPEGYMVKASHQQATYDMLIASRAVLDHLELTATKLFLAGWSQGGFVTMAMLEKLEQSGIKVDAAATASAPVDVFVALNGFLSFPRKNDASWVNSLFILSAFSFENYYGVPGLARSLIADAYYDVSRKAYQREPFNAADVPTDLHKLIRADYFDPQFFAASAYGRLVAQTQAYRWIVKSPVRNYFGESDEAISVGLGQLAMTYQRAIGNGNPAVEAISTGSTTHRGTFATAVPKWKAWFDGL
ncbi:prolyl oligopeptidase family serine peptidase [Bradyrhizobium diazoefficiens]|nr:alpha/beta fold hydrolase [Bradyrhizobium diazoefficiens]MBR0965827.1 prolyl oligopeptidase family serine peptidase [Bradyrhizobium diazoefficiens]MBR0975876.1 prolyl oligopeptidase family serine peptidase [Bradyrhizobium diazoefficiens]MBR1008834.1 prolyl oligopeptidase family serine peptidase [Bradyrhizobium diazoefficiens]MBR1015104.1 prolyl oligopeptidase family serine peptidase [Bradyrhizobium diazoefficiens]MBR1052777.1 prolyl oligopeptidase family serine peptidase [Bradyrhizobium dia